MKLAYENLEIWQLGMKLVELVYSFREKFPPEDKFGLWDQLVRSAEAVPRAIAEGYVKSSNKERALYIERAKSETAETDTSFKEAVKKGRITSEEYKTLVEPLIKELYFKIIGYRKWLLSDQPTPPSEAINQLPQAKRSKGFTLIELLVVIGIFGILAIFGTNMFFSILKGETKTRVLAEVKQNGNYALSVMGRMIRNARSIETCDLEMKQLKIKSPDEQWTEFDLSGARIASNAPELGRTGYLTSDKVEIDTTKAYQFDCVSSVGSPEVVTIRFTLSQSGAVTRPEEEATVDFKTTVSLRTY